MTHRSAARFESGAEDAQRLSHAAHFTVAEPWSGLSCPANFALAVTFSGDEEFRLLGERGLARLQSPALDRNLGYAGFRTWTWGSLAGSPQSRANPRRADFLISQRCA